MRDRVEAAFAALGSWCYEHCWITVLAIAAVAAPLIAQLPSLTIDNRTERMFLEGDPALDDYRAFREQFGTDQYIVLGLRPPEVFNLAFLETLRAIHREVEREVPHVAEVTSLVNARHTYGEADTLIVEDLMADWPETPDELATLRQRVVANPFYRNQLISADGRMTAILIRPRSVALPAATDIMNGFAGPAHQPVAGTPTGEGQLSSVEFAEMVHAVSELATRYRSPNLPIHVAGGPVVSDAINRAVPRDLAKLIPLSVLIIAVFLWILFRRPSGLFYPLTIVLLALLMTLGFMAWMGIPLSNISTVLTSFLTVVGVADSVHILSRFYQSRSEHASGRTAIEEAMRHSGLAVLMTSVTTATGLMSFVVADVRPIADLGIIAPLGVVIALLLTIFLLPALLALFPTPRPGRLEDNLAMDRFLAGVARISCAHSRTILLITLALSCAAALGMTRLRFSQNGLKWFKSHNQVRIDTETIDRELGGSLTIEPIIDTGHSDGLVDPDFLARLDRAMEWAESLEGDTYAVAKATSLNTVIKEINRALNSNDQTAYRVPSDPQLIAQELLLFEGTGADDLERLVDRDFSMVRATLTVPFRDAFVYVDLVDEVAAYFQTHFPQARITVTGSNVLFVKMFENIITTMAKSYLISLSVITLLMILLLGRLRIGLLSMVPNLFPLLVILGIMGWMGIPLDMSTVLIGSIAIGLVVDDTIHFMHNFRRDYEELGSVPEAVSRTLHTAGRAILITSVVLAGGFYSCMVSELRSSVIYGFLMGSTVLVALAADYLVTPALMMRVFDGSETR